MSKTKEARKAIKKQVQGAWGAGDKSPHLRNIADICDDDGAWEDPEAEADDEDDDDGDGDEEEDEKGSVEALFDLIPDEWADEEDE